jgi:virulence factor Mce-like protein
VTPEHPAGREAQNEFASGLARARQDDLAGAEAAFRRADQHGHPAAASSLGLLAESRGETAAARDAYRRADERGDWMGAMRLGLLASRANDWDGAGELWARAKGRDPSPETLELEGRLFGGAGGASEEMGPPPRSALAQPVLIGALTVLVLLVAVFLAYDANVGLPFVPSRELRVDVVDGSDLVVGNDVLESGFRVGFVESMRPVVLADGVPGGQLVLELTGSHKRVPVDSRVTILSRSVLGLKYVDIEVGHSRRVFADGGTMPVAQTSVPVRLDQIFDGYTPRTRVAIQRNLVGFGDVLAGRGSALNDTIAALPSLLGHLEPVARYLAAPRAELTRFLGALDAFTSAVAPVAQANVRLFADMATTFAAISSSRADLEATISESPSTLSVGTRSLAVQQPFLVNLTRLGSALAPATGELRAALPNIDPAIEAGTRTLARTPSLDVKLQGVMGALKALSQAPGTSVALNGLASTVDILDPMVRYLGPFVTVCNDWNYWWTNLAGDLDEETSFGYAQRALFNQGNPAQSNSVSSQGATAPANGGGSTSLPGVGGNEYLHDPVYGAAVDSQGNADCETGQRGYPLKLNHLDPQGRDFDTDSHTPGDQGTTFTGQAHVPKGETFSRNPITGPQAPYVAQNP